MFPACTIFKLNTIFIKYKPFYMSFDKLKNPTSTAGFFQNPDYLKEVTRLENKTIHRLNLLCIAVFNNLYKVFSSYYYGNGGTWNFRNRIIFFIM